MEVNKYDEKDRLLFSGEYLIGYTLNFDEDKWGASEYNYLNDSIIHVSNLDVYNINFNDNLGVASYKKHINKQGKTTRIVFYNDKMNFAQTDDKIVEHRSKYDERGNIIEDLSLDSLGNLFPFKEDVSLIKWEYDVNNNKTKTTYYNKNGQLANANQNVTYNVYKYNSENQLIERSNYNSNMEPQLLDGYFRTKIIINVKGLDSIIEDYDINFKPVKGVFKTIYDYNEYNNNISETFYNYKNQRTNSQDGVSLIKHFYDKRQHYIGYAYYDVLDKKVNNIKGYSYNLLERNEFGYVVSDTYYDKNDNPAIGSEGFHRKEKNWNELGELTEISTFGKNRKLIADQTGVAIYRYTISSSGLESSIKLFDIYGNPTNNNSGISETHYLPYLNGLYYLDKELDYLGNEINDNDKTE